MTDSAAPSAVSGAHWTIYLPSLAVAAVWVGVYVWADTRQPPLAAIRSIALAIEAVVVPLLLFHAFMRARNLRVEVAADEIDMQWGFTWRRRLAVPVRDVAAAEVRPAIAQRFFGGGALALTFSDGTRRMIADLAQPESIVRAILVDREKTSK
ncbi:PH domain-containing protein [uncultured Parvibaculum sp.]|uniref:PH domain-containing protein n=1 Tax=uncultured Parvibaculum sp. TaxID=291828 RepID=UPI0030D83FF6|tara:strand:- start:31736 stop:32194 length:459 start_codon:yes stop_codon:yes gene_type:complete